MIDDVLLAGYGEAMGSPSDGLGPRRARGSGRGRERRRAGRRADEARQALVAQLARLGFDPRLEGDDVRLCSCPVESLARARPEVVCAAHRGMTAALVDRIGQLEVTDAPPFADGETCLLRLRAL